jgi:hypothetical protein
MITDTECTLSTPTRSPMAVGVGGWLRRSRLYVGAIKRLIITKLQAAAVRVKIHFTFA